MHRASIYCFSRPYPQSPDSVMREIMKPIWRSSHKYDSRLAMRLSVPALVMLLCMVFLATSCTEQEKSSLLQFVAELSQDGGLGGYWKNVTDCCKWKGITCNSDGTVTDVFLPSRNLQGNISASLGYLIGLLHLNLSNNLLSGGLPLELMSSKSIVVLDVSFNKLTGPLPELQSSTGWPLQLQVLNISSNLFSGRFPSTTWKEAKSLVIINVSNNSFTGQIPTTFCVSALLFAVLDLSYNKFSGRIPTELGNCSMLTTLNAGYNHLNGPLPDEIFSMTSLKHLSFSNNQVEGSLGDISKLRNLAILDLGGNFIRGNIPDSIGELKGLQELQLGHNNMSGELPSTLGNCTDLRSINLGCNNFSGELTGFNFSTLTNLRYLDLMRNNFNGTFPESIYSCNNLTALRLSYNRFQGQLSERISNLKYLSFLSLVSCSLRNITSALQILRNCRNLNTLLVGKNFMHEAMPEDNRIDGFQKLQVLSLSDCSLYGNVPPWLSNLVKLEMLFLDNNLLTGSIPDWMGNLNFLFYIDISNNSLTGEIPTKLMEIQSLKTDKVETMVFELPIYYPIYTPKSLEYRVPRAFPKVLNLGMNNFTGVIPKEIGRLKALISLNLSSNKLAGGIPHSICKLINLQKLDLSGNHLTGRIPSELNNLHYLSQFNVSNNDLEGPIPIIGQLSTFTSSSFDGNPRLCGPMFVHQCGSTEEISPQK